MTATIKTPADFAQAMGWDFTAIESTAEKGVSECDRDALTQTAVTEQELLDWCLEQVADSVADVMADNLESTGSVYGKLAASAKHDDRICEAGFAVGRAIARDAQADGLPREWTGLDAQDGDRLVAAGIQPGTPEWELAEAAAKDEYERIMAE